jgi:hypothetical protein
MTKNGKLLKEAMENSVHKLYMAKGGPIVDPRGQWAHPGKITKIPSNKITMQGVPYPVYGVPDFGQPQMMYPGQEYFFPGAQNVTEYPKLQVGGGMYIPEGMTLPNVTVRSTKPSKWSKFIKFAPYDPNRVEPSLSQWNPKPGEIDAMEAADRARAEEENSFWNNPHFKHFRNSAFGDPKALAVAGTAALLGPQMIPYMGAALQAPIAGVAGLTGNNLLTAAAAYHGVKSLPNTVQSVKTAYNNPNRENVINAVNDVGWNALDLFPAASVMSKEVKPLVQEIGNAFNASGRVPGRSSLRSTTPRGEDPVRQTVFDPETGVSVHYDGDGNVIGNSKKLTTNEVKAINQGMEARVPIAGATPPPPEGMAPYFTANTDRMMAANAEWLQSPEYLSRRMAASGETAAQVKADVARILEEAKNTKFVVEPYKNKNLHGLYSRSKNPGWFDRNILREKATPAEVSVREDLPLEQHMGTLDHEIKHAMSQFAASNNYKGYPTLKVGNWFDRNIKGLGRHKEYLNEAPEQQVRFLKILEDIEKSKGIPKGETITPAQFDDWVDTRYNPYYSESANEDVVDLVNEIANKYGKDTRKKLLDRLNRAYLLPAGILTGAGALEAGKKEFGGASYVDEYPMMQKGGATFSGNAWYKMGGMPCYECGGMYAEGGYYDCPDQEKDPVTGKCKAEVVRGREANAANKAANADMNAWAKQVAAMDKEVAKQYAAQAAGQLTFDYDWMQSPVEKADKKAAIAQYKQFIQQNPNVFLADDSSGYSPEQKYIIASKLKQRMSTPMGSKLIQQKYGVDPKFYDLQRIQSDFGPKMGGWEGMRNFLFNIYKQKGGSVSKNTFFNKFIDNLYGYESEISRWLGNPMKKGAFAAKDASLKVLGPGNDAIDNYRHPMAGRYTAEAIQNKLGNVPIVSQAAGFLGANVLGLGHEIASLTKGATELGGKDKRSWYTKLRESGEDAFNNMVGAAIGSNPFMTPKQKSNYLLELSLNNRLPDGYGSTNMYIKKQGGPILDPRGQWAHPGKVTRIPGSDITMQGVNYPVYAKPNKGKGMMMFPGENYSFPNSDYVDEYPMMQFGGGTLLGPSTMLLSLASKAANYFSKPNSSETKKPGKDFASTPYKQMHNTFYNKNEEFYNKRNANDKMNYDSSVNPINLTSGRFRGAKVAPGMINDIVNAAKANNVDPWLMLSLVGRESTFGTDREYINHREANNKQDLISGWNVAEDYQPYEVNRYLADKKVPGIKVIKDSSGWNYEVEDQQAIESYLKSNPKLIEDYYKKLASTPDLGKLDSFSLAAQRIKKKGVKNYNPGDPRYPSMVNQDMNLLKNDAALKAYMKTLGYRQGGEFGGGLLSQTVSCSNCGHSWKAADGGYDPMTCHKCGGVVKMEGGGYVVTRSNDRKGKTHKVTGPDGTVKYFGDSKLGQHPKDPERKAAFYARHKKNLDGNPYFRAFARKTWEDGGTIPQYQFAGPVSKTDSVRHQAGKIVKYEDLQGGPGGAPLPIYRDPKYISMLMNDVYPEIQKILPNASAMEAGEAMDFVFNSGWDRDNKKMTKDPRAYAIQEYYRKYDPNKLTDTSWPDGPTWLGRKNAPYSFDQEYNSTIGKLSENERRVLMNKGRDWYYRHTAPKGSTWDLKTQGPHPDYNATWYGRIWNTNDFLPFNPNNPNFKPKKEDGGELSLWDMIKMAQGGEMIRRADGSYSKRGLWDNIRANKGSGKKPTKQMLEQERKIKAKNK